ncbi:MAG TPA: pyridoxal-dependent decarboxylase [Gemmatimonadaceae bacterium]|nr:pyridoxal-dependent decarboxylase [Gemmatimonadaceae bacterium]
MTPDYKEETLDPADWEELRALGHRMVDDMLAYMETVRERPAWQPIPADVRERFRVPVPRAPEGAERAYDDFVRDVLPYPTGNIHPRFWGWVMGNGTALGAMAEMMAATMNPNLGGAEHAANHVERQVIDWCKEMLGYPAEASGLLVSGGSMANLVGLTVARHAMAGFDVRKQGVAASPGMMTIYGSVEMHSSIQKAVELLGLGSEALRLIPVNDEMEMDIAALERAIAADRAAGRRPICVVGNAGTVATGATDDLARLADLCARERLWFHVDGAFGALAALLPEMRPRLAGMERADSLAFDLHKWMYMPYEVGCALVRHEELHRRAFSLTPDYLTHSDRGAAAGELWFSDYGVQLSRGFRALKVWMSLKEHGLDRYARLVRQNIEQARYLAELVRAAPDLELLAPAALNIVCFRYVGEAAAGETRDEEALDALNRELLIQLHERGIAVPSNAQVNGRFALRVAITNHRSRREDFELLVREARGMGAELVVMSNE